MSPKKPTVRQRVANLWGRTSEARFRAKNFFLSKSIGLKLGVKPRPIPAIFENVARSIRDGSKRILLVYPPKARNVSTAYGEAISLALIHRKKEAEMLGWKVQIVNLAAEPRPHKALENAVRGFNPQVIGFSTTSPSDAMAFSLAKALNKSGLANNRLIIKGGPGTEYSFPFVNSVFGKKSPIDVFFLGDADQSFRPFLATLENGKISDAMHMPGIGLSGRTLKPTALESDISRRTAPNAADIEAMREPPFPSVLFAREKERRGETAELFGRIQTLTNCAFGCSFCAVSSLRGAQTRMDVHEAAKQVRELVGRGIRNFYFEDATFLTDTMRGGAGIFTRLKNSKGQVIGSQSFAGWTERFLSELKKIKGEEERKGKTIRFGIQTRIDSLNGNIIRELSEAGCTNVFLGVETLEAKSLKHMHKGVIGSAYKEQQLEHLFGMLLNAGINPTVSLIAGRYTGGLGNFKHTIQKMREFGVQEIFMQAAAIYPGTGDWRNLRLQEGRHVVLSYLSPGSVGSGVSRRGVNPEDQMQYHKWDSRRALKAYYRMAANVLSRDFVQINPGHYLRKQIYNWYRAAFR